MKISLLLILFFLARPMVASDASVPELDRLRSTLQNAMSQYEMNMASSDLAKYWDHMLKATEAEILADTLVSDDPKTKRLFQEAQKAWRKFRDSEAAFQAETYRGGTMQPLIRSSTYASLTEQRVRELRDFLKPKG
ncbi:MAG: DUF1311 domain-containing protein [Opitutae bacterium]|nr:DUF1311 domain-containing protein [Opitutae bacterium]